MSEVDPRVPVAAPGTGHVRKGQPLTRIDGPAKVQGQARYAAEFPAPDLAYGVVVNTAVAGARLLRSIWMPPWPWKEYWRCSRTSGGPGCGQGAYSIKT